MAIQTTVPLVLASDTGIVTGITGKHSGQVHRPPGEGAGNCVVGAVGMLSSVSPLWTLQCRASGPDQMLRQHELTAERTVTRAGQYRSTQLLTGEPRLENAPRPARVFFSVAADPDLAVAIYPAFW